MPFYLFLWTQELAGHLAENGVSQNEFEEIVCAPGQLDTSRTTGRPIAIGTTASGRVLVCVYEHVDSDTILPVTAFEPEEEGAMKRTPRRAYVQLSAEKKTELRHLQSLIQGGEKKELTKVANSFRRQQRATEVELAQAAALLREERHEQGLSLADLHEKSGISRAAICRLENLVDANPTVATLDRMAAALGKKLVIALRDRES